MKFYRTLIVKPGPVPTPDTAVQPPPNPHKPVEGQTVRAQAIWPYQVLLHNNNRTPFENVTDTLQQHFGLNADDAYRLMMLVHQRGKAPVAKFESQQLAEAKVVKAMAYAAALPNGRGGVLKFTAEKV